MLFALLVAPLLAAQLTVPTARSMTLAGKGGEAARYQLAVPLHAREVRSKGLVVRASASESAGVTRAELDVKAKGVAQHIDLGERSVGADALLRSIDIVDANFDGHPDIIVLRELGAKWSRVDVFLFDPGTRRFTQSSGLSRALSSLSNATFDSAHKTVTTRDFGPSNPSRTTYAITSNTLRTVDSCRFVNPAAERVGTLVRSHGAVSTYTRLSLSPFDVEPCGL